MDDFTVFVEEEDIPLATEVTMAINAYNKLVVDALRGWTKHDASHETRGYNRAIADVIEWLEK